MLRWTSLTPAGLAGACRAGAAQRSKSSSVAGDSPPPERSGKDTKPHRQPSVCAPPDERRPTSSTLSSSTSSSSGVVSSAGSSSSTAQRAPRRRNKILMLCTALGPKDTPQWPFWKWHHLKATRGVTDVAMLAVTRQDSFIGTISNGVASVRTLRRGMKTVEPRLLKSFLDTHYVPDSYFVYGGHGVSDLLEFNKDHRMQVHELADCFAGKTFHGILFDACLMASLDTAYYLRNAAPFIGASEGYMWEEDTWSDNHMFNPYSASLMSRDSNGGRVLRMIGEDYVSKSALADFSVIDTGVSQALWDHVHRHHLAAMHSSVTLRPGAADLPATPAADPPDGDETGPVVSIAKPRIPKDLAGRVVPAPLYPPARTSRGAAVPRDPFHRGHFEFPHSVYPDERCDDHIVDLRAHLSEDKEGLALLDRALPFRNGPSKLDLYGVRPLGGMNFSFSQYSYQAYQKPIAVAGIRSALAHLGVATDEHSQPDSVDSSHSTDGEAEVRETEVRVEAARSSTTPSAHHVPHHVAHALAASVPPQHQPLHQPVVVARKPTVAISSAAVTTSAGGTQPAIVAPRPMTPGTKAGDDHHLHAVSDDCLASSTRPPRR